MKIYITYFIKKSTPKLVSNPCIFLKFMFHPFFLNQIDFSLKKKNKNKTFKSFNSKTCIPILLCMEFYYK